MTLLLDNNNDISDSAASASGDIISFSLDKKFSDLIFKTTKAICASAIEKISAQYDIPKRQLQRILKSVQPGFNREVNDQKKKKDISNEREKCQKTLKGGTQCQLKRAKDHPAFCTRHKPKDTSKKDINDVLQSWNLDAKIKNEYDDMKEIETKKGFYVNEETNIVFKITKNNIKTAVGTTNEKKDEFYELSESDIEICRQRGWTYKLKKQKKSEE